MHYILLLGRILFSLIFILSAIMGHFSHETVAFAAQHGVPAADILVPFSGVLALLGGISIFLGYKARYGAWLIVIFLIPSMYMMHRFWDLTDPYEMMMQRAMFMKNLSMLGAALMITYFGSGPMSIDKRKRA